MKRWVLAGGALIVAAAVGLTVWSATRPDSRPEFKTPWDAVSRTCHGFVATPSRSVPDATIGPHLYADYLRARREGGEFTMVWRSWRNTTRVFRFADVERARSGKYRVVACATKKRLSWTTVKITP